MCAISKGIYFIKLDVESQNMNEYILDQYKKIEDWLGGRRFGSLQPRDGLAE